MRIIRYDMDSPPGLIELAFDIIRERVLENRPITSSIEVFFDKPFNLMHIVDSTTGIVMLSAVYDEYDL